MNQKQSQTGAVKKRYAEDIAIEERIRAHLRQQMRERLIDMTTVAERIGYDNGAMSRVLNGKRGIGLGLVARIVKGLKISASRLLEEDPPQQYFAVGSEKAPQNNKVAR